jgi:hypothetical protein
MKINIEEIDHREQRYPTVGDWWLDTDGVLQVRVSRLSDPRYGALVVLHELVEVLIEGVKRTGRLAIPQALIDEVDAFDKRYEADRPKDDDTSEPGSDPTNPAYRGHMAAMATEHIAAMLFGINWNTYNDEVMSL